MQTNKKHLKQDPSENLFQVKKIKIEQLYIVEVLTEIIVNIKKNSENKKKRKKIYSLVFSTTCVLLFSQQKVI